MECELLATHTARALKKALPERSVVSKDARATVNAAASMFVLYLTAIAQDNAAASKRQTVVLKDVLQALRDADFEHFIAPVEECLRETKVAAALKKSKRGGVERAGGEDGLSTAAAPAGDAVDEDEEMQSAEDNATDDDDDNGADEQDADDEEKDDADEANVDTGDMQDQRLQETAEGGELRSDAASGAGDM